MTIDQDVFIEPPESCGAGINHRFAKLSGLSTAGFPLRTPAGWSCSCSARDHSRAGPGAGSRQSLSPLHAPHRKCNVVCPISVNQTGAPLLCGGDTIPERYMQFHSKKKKFFSGREIYATNSTTPPASLIFLSASLLTYLARTTIGISGSRPFPRTLE